MKKVKVWHIVIASYMFMTTLALMAMFVHIQSQPIMQAEAITGTGKFKLVYSVSESWGEMRIIRNDDTKVGYLQVRDHNGNITAMEEIRNALGEPVRFDDFGNPLARIEPERWRSIDSFGVESWHRIDWSAFKYNHKGE